MHPIVRMRTFVWAGVLALAAAAAMPTPAAAVPKPGAPARGFRLFAKSLGALTVNRVFCGLSSTGEVCRDSSNSPTGGGGFWPKGTPDQYIFNSGLQIAGIVGPDGGAWAGDTTGAFFFDPKGTTEHGQEVTPIYNSQDPADFSNWPAAALVPQSGVSSDFYFPLLRGQREVSQGDVWFLSWEGNPGQIAGRPHPLGVLVEVRGFGWNYPRGNEDVLYFVYNFYNITSTNPVSYAAHRPEIVPLLLQAAQDFHARNNGFFGITLPTDGYTISEMYAAFSRDDDVTSAANQNYSSVNLPFALGYTYERSFFGPTYIANAGWQFPPDIFGAPFFPGPGFTGAKYLASPTGPGAIQLFSNTINGSPVFDDAQNTTQLWRYLSGNLDQSAGDGTCGANDPVVDHICFINNGAASDMRFFQSSTALNLAPGAAGSIVVAYIHAAPVALPTFTGTSTSDIKPGDPRYLGNAALMAAPPAGSSARVDSLTGLLDFNDDGDGIVTQSEFVVVSGSLLGKSLTAQTIFDNQFLLPQSPRNPDFFLVPGDNEVTVFWQASDTETAGDLFFDIASQPEIGGEANALYDANYRRVDVEGYRVYRGRVNSPNELTLIAQFDHNLTTFDDFYGVVNPSGRCMPEVGINDTCATVFDPQVPGVPLSAHVTYSLSGVFQQVVSRVELADGSILITAADTAVIGAASGQNPDLTDTGVPFVFVDRNVRNGFRYFYAVAAFDVNSIRSGPSSIESARITKAVVPSKSASNYAASGAITGLQMLGRGTVLDPNDPNPTIDPTTGVFSGPAAPANAWSLDFAELIATVLDGDGAFSVRLDSIGLGSPYASTPVPHRYFYSAPSSGAIASVAIVQQVEIGVSGGNGTLAAAALDDDFASRYGGSSAYSLPAQIDMEIDGADYTSLYGRGCVNSRPGFTDAGAANCAFNGSRWFDGGTETFAHPIGGNGPNFSTTVAMTSPNNAGSLTGVVNIYSTQSYQSAGGASYRGVEGIKSGAKRAADFNVYWGEAGLVDSVVDVTHNVPLPFDSATAGGGWGLLNASETPPGDPGNQSYDRRAELTNADVGCVEPFRSYRAGIACGLNTLVAPRYFFSRIAIPGPIVTPLVIPNDGINETRFRTAAPQPNDGFVMYVAGDFFTFELAGGALPADGTVWTLRAYIGAVSGGRNDTGSIDYGPYIFNPSATRTMSAIGVELAAQYSVTNTTALVNNSDLSRVHTVPDPYYVTSEFEATTNSKIIRFVGLPQQAIIRIYSASGVLVRVLEHSSEQFAGEAVWDVRNRNNQVVASGVYFYHVETGDARKVGRFTVVNFAQ